MSQTRLAYLVSRYPALSHTFILREVLSLRQQGLFIRVASINPPDRPVGELTPDEQSEAINTFCIKRAGSSMLFAACVSSLLKHPRVASVA